MGQVPARRRRYASGACTGQDTFRLPTTASRLCAALGSGDLRSALAARLSTGTPGTPDRSRSAWHAVAVTAGPASCPCFLLGQMASPDQAGRAGVPARLQKRPLGGGAGRSCAFRRGHGPAYGVALSVPERALPFGRRGGGDPRPRPVADRLRT